MKQKLSHSPSLLAKSNLIILLKTSFSILNTYIRKEKSYSLNIALSSLLLSPFTPLLSKPIQNPEVVFETYENTKINPLPEPIPQLASSKIVLKSTVSAETNDKGSKEMPLLLEKAKLQNIIIKKLAHVQEKSNGLMNRSNIQNESVKKDKEEVVDVGNISILLEKNLSRNFTPNKTNKKGKTNNNLNTKYTLTPSNDKILTKKSMIKDSKIMQRSQLIKSNQNNNIKQKNAKKVPQLEFTIDFEQIKKKNDEIKAKKKNNVQSKK